MKKSIKIVSHLMVLSMAPLSFMQSIEAQTEKARTRQIAQKVKERAIKAINSAERRIQNLLNELDAYRRCSMSKEGCSPERRLALKRAGRALGAAVTILLLFLIGRHKKTSDGSSIRYTPFQLT